MLWQTSAPLLPMTTRSPWVGMDDTEYVRPDAVGVTEAGVLPRAVWLTLIPMPAPQFVEYAVP